MKHTQPSGEYNRIFADVVFTAKTIEEGVKDRNSKRSLTRAQLKLFYTVLKRTKGYIEAAQDQLQEKILEEKIKAWNDLFGQDAPD